MKRITSILIFLVFLSSTAFSQTVKGHIYDARTEQPLPGVNITYETKEGKKGIASDGNGYYELNIPAGGIHLTFSFIGYKPELVPLVLKPRDRKSVV